MDATLLQSLAMVAAAFVAGMMNSIAGGGTLVTFPVLLWVGLDPKVANATSTVALWPGALGSMLGYRRELKGMRGWALAFAVPSLVGGLVGAWLLLKTPPERFAALVPWLVLGATALFMVQGWIARVVRGRRRQAPSSGERTVASTLPNDVAALQPPLSTLVFQGLVAVYGGYFGAGVGILMLASLGFAGFTNIHQMNGLKNWGGLCMNAVAAVTFAFSDIVSWPVALSMAAGATVGGYAGSRLAQRVPQAVVRRAIVLIGLGSGLWMLVD